MCKRNSRSVQECQSTDVFHRGQDVYPSDTFTLLSLQPTPQSCDPHMFTSHKSNLSLPSATFLSCSSDHVTGLLFLKHQVGIWKQTKFKLMKPKMLTSFSFQTLTFCEQLLLPFELGCVLSQPLLKATQLPELTNHLWGFSPTFKL